MHESKVILTHKKIKQFRRWCFCSYNKPFDLFSLLLMLKTSIFENSESMASTYAKICWIVVHFSTLSFIQKKKTFSGHKIDPYYFLYPFPCQFSISFRLIRYDETRQNPFTVPCLQICKKIAVWSNYPKISLTL